MTLPALALVLAAALLHAGWNALAKRGGDPLLFLWVVGGLGTLLFLPASVWIVWRQGLPWQGLPFVLATVLLHALYFFALGRAYRAGDFSLVYPVARGLGVVLVPVLALPLLDERLSRGGALGVALVVVGVLVLHWRPGAWGRMGAPAPGLGWAVLTGLAIAAYSLVDKAGVARVHPILYIGLLELGSWLVLMPVAFGKREALRREWRGNRRTILAAAFMSPTAYCLVLFAFQRSPAGYVVAAREMSIVLSALIGSLWLGEGDLARRLLGAAVVLAGVAAVALAG